jgi:hypothetical protein
LSLQLWLKISHKDLEKEIKIMGSLIYFHKIKALRIHRISTNFEKTRLYRARIQL